MRGLFLVVAAAVALSACSDPMGMTDRSQIAGVIWVDGVAYAPAPNVEGLAPAELFGTVEGVHEWCDPAVGLDAPWAGQQCQAPDTLAGIWANSLPVGTPIRRAGDRPTEIFLMTPDPGEETWRLVVSENYHGLISGEVIARNVSTVVGAGLPNIHVGTGDECGVIFAIDPDTELVAIEGGSTVPATVDDLTVGARVEAWSPAIAESCPAQAIAYFVRVLE